MPRAIRFIREGGALVEITDRTVQSRFLLGPSPELNDIILGVLGRAQRLHGVGGLCGATALIDGTPVQGSWFDPTKEYSARQRGEEISPRQFATEETPW